MSEPAPGTAVLDSSALVALLADGGSVGDWVAMVVTDVALAAPHLALFEAANILRRQQLAGELDATAATLAHQDLLALPIQLWPYSLLAERSWQLREHVTGYDAAYVTLAELLDVPVVTLDRRLGRAPGLRCPVLVPPAPSGADAGDVRETTAPDKGSSRPRPTHP